MKWVLFRADSPKHYWTGVTDQAPSNTHLSHLATELRMHEPRPHNTLRREHIGPFRRYPQTATTRRAGTAIAPSRPPFARRDSTDTRGTTPWYATSAP